MCGQICVHGAFPLRPYVYLTQRTHRLKATISHAKGSGAMQKVHTWQPHLNFILPVFCVVLSWSWGCMSVWSRFCMLHSNSGWLTRVPLGYAGRVSDDGAARICGRVSEQAQSAALSARKRLCPGVPQAGQRIAAENRRAERAVSGDALSDNAVSEHHEEAVHQRSYWCALCCLSSSTSHNETATVLAMYLKSLSRTCSKL